jgi:hypothetical protein
LLVQVLCEPEAAERIVPAATWPAIAKAADRLGIAPLLHHKLRHAGICTLLPPEPAAFLKEAHQRSLVRNLRVYAELAEILAYARRARHLVLGYGGLLLGPLGRGRQRPLALQLEMSLLSWLNGR